LDGSKFTLVRDGGAYVSAAAADRIIASSDGNAALLYIYLLRHGTLEENAAARALGRTVREVQGAAERLCAMGLISQQAANRKLPSDEIPQYTNEDIVSRSQEDAAFRAVVDEAQGVLGKKLSGADLKTLFGIYDYLGLPAEVILLLINYCVTRVRAKYGPGRVPTMRTIEKEAYSWSNQEIITLDRAEEYLDKMRQRGEKLTDVRARLGIHDRVFTPSERQYVESWLEMGFSPEAIAIAYDRTVTRKGKIIWAYMDSIIRSWQEKGLHTPEEIAAGDSAQKPASRRPSASAETEKKDVAYLKKLMDEMNVE
jgi:DnaD/phage-associated family protein